VFYVPRNKRCLFRLVNAGSHNCPTEFSIQGCKLKVTASDSYSICPVMVDRIVSQPGERYDFVMESPKDPLITQILIVARGLGGCARLQLQEFAKIRIIDNMDTHKPQIEDREPILRPSYLSLEDANATYLNHPNTNCSDLTSKNLCVVRLVQKGVACPTGENLRNAKIEKRFYLEFRNTLGTARTNSYLTVGPFALKSLMNNISFIHPYLPPLTQNYTGLEFCNAENLPSRCSKLVGCDCFHVMKLGLCKVYEFHLYDNGQIGGGISHPFHMHGYGFQVCDMGTRAQFANGTSTTPYSKLKCPPPVKDVISIPSGCDVRIRIKACNPGFWLLHCHFEFHMMTGMMAVLQVGEDSDMVKPPHSFPKCGNFMPPAKIPSDQIKELPPGEHSDHTDTENEIPYEEMPYDHSMH